MAVLTVPTWLESVGGKFDPRAAMKIDRRIRRQERRRRRNERRAMLRASEEKRT